MKSCQVCGALNKIEAKFCIKCGSEIKESYLFCVNCGKKVLSSNRFCKYCGGEVKKPLSSEIAFSSNTKIAQPSQIYIENIKPEKTPTSAKPRKSHKKLIITLSIVLPIAFTFLAVIIFLAISIFPLDNTAKIKAEMGPDQQRVIKLFGYPDQFLITFDESNNNSRIDVWTFSEMETTFIFEKGAYDSTKEYYNKVFLEDKQKVFPDNFIYGMTPDEVKTLISKESEESIDEITGLKVLNFDNGGIICVFNPEDKLVIVSKQLKISDGI